MTKICAYCKKEFNTHRKEKKFCSRECLQKGQNFGSAVCALCEKTFIKKSNNTKWCEKCQKEGLRLAQKRRDEKRQKRTYSFNNGVKITHKCCDCGKITPNHRCPACLEAWRRKHGVNFTGNDYYVDI